MARAEDASKSQAPRRISGLDSAMLSFFRNWYRNQTRDQRNAFHLFFVVLVSCSYFFIGGGFNQASRFNLVRAVVEHQTVKIDAYHDNTGDKAQFRGHYYCDKAPGASLIAVPFVAISHVVAEQFDVEKQTSLSIEARIATFVGSALPTAFAAAAIYMCLRRVHTTQTPAALAALVYGLGTPAWAYGTLYWGHALSAGCLIVAFAFVQNLQRRPWSFRCSRSAFLIGLIGGWATITEFTAAIVCVFLGLWVVKIAAQSNWECAFNAVVMTTLGAIGPIVLLGYYNYLAFDSLWHLGYSSVVGFDGMQQGFFGITRPRAFVLERLIYGTKRGLLVCSPVLALAPIGLTLLILNRRYRAVGVIALATISYYLLLNAAYHYWDGGFSYGPRHVGAGLPFLCLGLCLPFSYRGIGTRWIQALIVLSIGITLCAVAVNPMPSDYFEFPLVDLFLTQFAQGKLSLNTGDFYATGTTRAINWGEQLGLKGVYSLLPLFMFWNTCFWFWRRDNSEGRTVQKTERECLRRV
jgi:hypothetical protein